MKDYKPPEKISVNNTKETLKITSEDGAPLSETNKGGIKLPNGDWVWVSEDIEIPMKGEWIEMPVEDLDLTDLFKDSKIYDGTIPLNLYPEKKKTKEDG